MKKLAEVWKSVKGYEGFYEVSNLGRIKSLDRLLKGKYRLYRQPGKLLKPRISNGYKYVNLCKNGKIKVATIHTLVLSTFRRPAKPREIANHKDGVKSNNSLKNLEWCTYRENALHAFRIGLRKRKLGMDNNSVKLTNTQVLKIRTIRAESKLSYRKLGKLFGITGMACYDIISRKTWKHI